MNKPHIENSWQLNFNLPIWGPKQTCYLPSSFHKICYNLLVLLYFITCFVLIPIPQTKWKLNLVGQNFMFVNIHLWHQGSTKMGSCSRKTVIIYMHATTGSLLGVFIAILATSIVNWLWILRSNPLLALILRSLGLHQPDSPNLSDIQPANYSHPEPV